MINFKKSTGKVGKVKRDLRINLDTIINKNLEIEDTDLDGEKVMMNLEKGEYFMMNEVGSRIWEIISKPINVKDIIETLRSEYEVDEEENCQIPFLYSGSGIGLRSNPGFD